MSIFQVSMNFGRRDATRATLQMCSLILLLGYLRLYHLGLEYIVCKGEHLYCPNISSMLIHFVLI